MKLPEGSVFFCYSLFLGLAVRHGPVAVILSCNNQLPYVLSSFSPCESCHVAEACGQATDFFFCETSSGSVYAKLVRLTHTEITLVMLQKSLPDKSRNLSSGGSSSGVPS